MGCLFCCLFVKYYSEFNNLYELFRPKSTLKA